jgi:putative phosphoesterase
MTRIAVVSDIHGSMAALDAVVEDVARQSPDVIVHAGDLVLNGPRPADVVDRIRELGWPGVVGNTDEMLWNEARRAGQEERAPRLRPLLRVLFEDSAPATREMLGEERIAWLRTLESEWRLDQMPVVHARPGDLWSAPTPDASDEELVGSYGGQSARIVIYGHIHRPYVRTVGPGLTVANSGSAGLSYDGDWRASYLLFEDEDATPEIRRIEYDIESEARDLSASNYPNHEWLVQIKRTGRYQDPTLLGK